MAAESCATPPTNDRGGLSALMVWGLVTGEDVAEVERDIATDGSPIIIRLEQLLDDDKKSYNYSGDGEVGA